MASQMEKGTHPTIASISHWVHSPVKSSSMASRPVDNHRYSEPPLLIHSTDFHFLGFSGVMINTVSWATKNSFLDRVLWSPGSVQAIGIICLYSKHKFPLEFLGYRVYLLYCSSLGFPLRRAIFLNHQPFPLTLSLSGWLRIHCKLKRALCLIKTVFLEARGAAFETFPFLGLLQKHPHLLMHVHTN